MIKLPSTISLIGKHIVFASFYGCLAIFFVALSAAVWLLNSRPDLQSWHSISLENEFRATDSLTQFSHYLERENALFAELEHKLEQEIYQDKNLSNTMSRYQRRGLANPNKWHNRWNRTQFWPNEQAEYGVILLHGMSDSPYALSHLATHLSSKAEILSLRLPGHGTLPSGLLNLTWQDLSAAVALAVDEMTLLMGDKPLYLIGFSTGAALALQYELTQIDQGKSPVFDKMIFISPAIGLPSIAVMAQWQVKLADILGLDKLYWNSISPEYDPFKYNSFAVNAADVVYQLIEQNNRLLSKLSPVQLQQLPDILTFQSITDATVSVKDIISELYLNIAVEQQSKSEHELVLFDINRSEYNLNLLLDEPLTPLEPFIEQPAFKLTFIENQSLSTGRGSSVQERVYLSDGQWKVTQLPLHWPRDIFSLSHTALPIPKEDPLYGIGSIDSEPHIQLGILAPRGERGLMRVNPEDILRQRWNPFYPYMLEKIDNFLL